MSDSSDDDMPLIRPGAKKTAPPAPSPAGRQAPLPKLLGDGSDSEDDVPLASKRPTPAKVKKEPAATPKLKPKPKVKKEVVEDSTDTEDDVPIAKKRTPVAKRPSSAAAAKKKPAAAKKPVAAKTKDKENSKPVKEKKEPKFEMPGQTRETPPENDPLRAFYSSLYDQTSSKSDMAAKWMMMNGLFTREVAEATVERFKQQKAKAGSSPARPGSAVKKSPARPASALKRKSSASGGSGKKKVAKK